MEDLSLNFRKAWLRSDIKQNIEKRNIKGSSFPFQKRNMKTLGKFTLEISISLPPPWTTLTAPETSY